MNRTRAYHADDSWCKGNTMIAASTPDLAHVRHTFLTESCFLVSQIAFLKETITVLPYHGGRTVIEMSEYGRLPTMGTT